MSLNWKEINLVLEELSLEGSQIQNAVQSAFDVIVLRIHKKGETKNILICLGAGACRLHGTFSAFPKHDKPLRFAQFLNSRVVNGWITEAVQLGDNRTVRITVKRGEFIYKLYVRLWSNAANFIVTDSDGVVLDAMRRMPKKGEVTGGTYIPENTLDNKKTSFKREYEVRQLEGGGSFCEKLDKYYAEKGGSLSLEALKEQAKRDYEGSMGRIAAALERLREKEASFADAGRFKEYGDLILSNIALIELGSKWLDAQTGNSVIRITLDPLSKPSACAEKYYEQYRKSKNGLSEIKREIETGEKELKDVNEKLEKLLEEKNPLVLAKLLKSISVHGITVKSSKKEKSRPGLSFKRGEWLIIVGRDAGENDVLLRRYVKGNDLWLHARDYHGSYVFIKQRAGKSVPLDILLDAGNLAVFYSKGRNNRKGDLFYTQVKYLRRAKNGPKGLVIPTQEKNIHVVLDDERLRSLEQCKIFSI